jgi:hypothetical protein
MSGEQAEELNPGIPGGSSYPDPHRLSITIHRNVKIYNAVDP